MPAPIPPQPPRPARAPRRALLRTLALILLTCLLAAPASTAAADGYPFRDPDLPLDERIDDLLGRLTLEEKVSLLHQYSPAIGRLGIGEFKTGSEALHGVAWLGEATVFPQAVGFGATWDPGLLEEVGSVTGLEMRGKHAEDPAFNGLNVWSPVVDLQRDPRWGRNEEGYSEDALLTGALSSAYAGGMRGDDDFYLQTAPTLKHFAAYNLEEQRHLHSSSVPPRVMNEYVFPAFRQAIADGNATGIMAAYNLVNGRPAHLNPDINDEVRSWSDDDLLVVADAFGPFNVAGDQGYYDTHPEGFGAQLRAGIDSFTQDSDNPDNTVAFLTEALDTGLITEGDVDAAVGHTLSIRFRLGEFDPDERNPYSGITPDVIDQPEHRELAYETALAQMTLLKNDGGLPLDPEADSDVAVIGPLADTLYEDWYSGTMPYQATPAEGIAERLGPDGSVTVSEGADQVALRTDDGGYLTASADPEGDLLRVADAEPGTEQTLTVFDWGEGIVHLRTEANGKVIGFDLDDTWEFYNDQDQPNGWFVTQQFEFVERDDGGHALRYAGREGDWFQEGRYLVVDDDGVLRLGGHSPEEGERFTIETVADGAAEAVEAAQDADAAVVVLGNMPLINVREEHDREDLDLIPAQEQLLQEVFQANPNTVLVVESGYPYALNWADDNVPAILWTSHAGQETGNAMADVLYGDHNPGGSVAQTWYSSAEDLGDMLDYDIISAGHTYQYSDAEVLYPFGHGLSYTDFHYGKPKIRSLSIDADGEAAVRVKVTNTGEGAGSEVVQLYTRQQESRVAQPDRQLRDFQRVHLEAGKSETVELTLRAEDLAFWDVTQGRDVVEAATHDVLVGSSSADIRGEASIAVDGEDIAPRDLSQDTRAADFDGYSGYPGVQLKDETGQSGDVVHAAEDGTWIAFHDVDLGAEPDTFSAWVTDGAPDARIEIREGSPDGPELGRVNVPGTDDPYDWQWVSARLTGAEGVSDVYLVFTGNSRVSEFSLT